MNIKHLANGDRSVGSFGEIIGEDPIQALRHINQLANAKKQPLTIS